VFGTKTGVAALLLRHLRGLRFPQLLALTAALFALDLFVPDAVPLIDELLLGLTTLLLASWRRRGEKSQPE
jgi:hypothetical protein